MALHDVAAEPVRGAQRQLEVDVGALRGLGERGAAQRLVHHLGAELPVGDRRRGQADAVDCDRVALGDLLRQPRAHAERDAVARRLHGGDPPEVLNEPGEHAHHSLSRAEISTSPRDPLDVDRQRARRLRDALDALALERVARVGAAEHDRRDEQPQLVELTGVEERPGELRPTLEQDRRDAGGAQLVERRAHARRLVLTRRDDRPRRRPPRAHPCAAATQRGRRRPSAAGRARRA